MKKDRELIVITQTYDLILWSCNHTSKFPRNHRFVLGDRIEYDAKLYGHVRERIREALAARGFPTGSRNAISPHKPHSR
jgi:hypothetical protein